MPTDPFQTPSKTSDVRLVLYDMIGKEVQVLASGEYDAGEHRILGNLSNIPSGPYLVLLRSEEDVLYRQIQVIH